MNDFIILEIVTGFCMGGVIILMIRTSQLQEKIDMLNNYLQTIINSRHEELKSLFNNKYTAIINDDVYRLVKDEYKKLEKNND